MGDENPYQVTAEITRPEKASSITFLPENRRVELDPRALPYTWDRQLGSILEIPGWGRNLVQEAPL